MSTKYVLLVLVMVTMVQTVKTNTPDYYECKTEQGYSCKVKKDKSETGVEPCVDLFSCVTNQSSEEKCWSATKLCDRTPDCADGSDEKDCNYSPLMRHALFAIMREQRDIKDTIAKQLDDTQSNLDAIEELITCTRIILIAAFVASVVFFIIIIILIVGLAVCLNIQKSLTSARNIPNTNEPPSVQEPKGRSTPV